MSKNWYPKSITQKTIIQQNVLHEHTKCLQTTPSTIYEDIDYVQKLVSKEYHTEYHHLTKYVLHEHTRCFQITPSTIHEDMTMSKNITQKTII